MTRTATGMTTVPGSTRSPIGTRTARAAAGDRVQVTLVLRRRSPLPDATRVDPTTFADRYGAGPADVAAVTSAMRGAGLDVVEADPRSRRVRVEGSVGDLEAVFGAQLHTTRIGDRTFRTRSGGLSVPAALDGIVVAVLGLDNRPQAATRHLVAPRAAVSASYSPLQLASTYQFPQSDGSGQTIAIIELGGGFGQSDLDSYFGGLGVPTPTVTAVAVDGAANQPGSDPNGADGEVLLDIEVAGAIAPAAHLVVYFAPNTDAGFHDAIATAAHATPTPAAISISWGQSEDQWSQQARTALDSACADAGALGVVVLAAAGDNGSSDNQSPGSHADFPASSPNVVGCGGTTLHTSGSTVTETVWNDGGQGGATGGGISDVFALPAWQQTAGVPAKPGTTVPGRGVPDVAGNADPQTGYDVLVDGQQMVIGGTSAVAPLWAGLIARLATLAGGQLGPALPKLYAGVRPGQSPTGLRDITQGSNGAYSAAAGWDPCTGLGVPAGQIAQLLSRSATSTA